MARLRRSRAAVSGFLNIHKPAGVTSHHCVSVVRKIFNTTEVGHAGTLDPMATGVLVTAIGRATKFLQYLTSDKEYRGVVRFGVTTDTDDITGEVLTEQAVPWVTQPLVRSHLDSFVGSIDQMPPRISALKQGGKRLYNLARANKAFDVAPRRVEIHGIDLLEFVAGNFPEAALRVSCGAGTYIRSIARECGEAMEIPHDLVPAESSAPLKNPRGQPCVGGTLVSLERTRSGVFTVNHSVSFEQVRGLLEAGQDPVQPIESAVQHLPLVSLIPPRVAHWYMGGEVAIHPSVVRVALDSPELSPLIPNIHVRVYDNSHRFLGVSQVDATPSRGFILRRRNFAVDPPQPVIAKEEIS